ncbi:MAG: phosphomannomutase/phosphoglucomutase [Cobetia sp.]|jgi:phosphomannomutase/phosphoglucomutase|uniref:phosphomannomutase n=1 Tax=Cobetia amphilecti TaxID=1055104 RepID=A0AAP4WX91_9GAMM|nr:MULTISPECIES: phosphomannomutase/phosphoglucomutase [Cobetia]AVV34407.1 phosphomannomutase/phosphoglucomutase [Halomonas sp. SF2003]MBR9755468.1 phosphomannomutase/phosphoglucomutase [Gammaproteobacteria bacterium]TCJ27283.1 phosphomannomutase/phosphoglucomutase [Halomonas sp. GDM18]KPM77699.1 phosphoglucomutase [Cobetia sp. UCD-24C]MBE2169769.1 phosphomannomutase/phosphoglucomutase [Cobetia sp. 2AS1]|tara:strand:- start:1423 stop:2805 length:1383 start_codon:yes stop_codon:yes gene_type:complete
MSQVPASIFRAYDIRGIVDETLTEDGVRAIGQSIGSEAAARGESTVVVARDGRLSGPRLSKALIAGLRDAGRDVVDIGMVPTPVLYYATNILEGTRSGVMLTGSHNPANYNGLKIVLAGETLSGDTITDLYRRLQEGDLAQGEGSLREEDVRERYLEQITGDVVVKRPLKAVVDCGNGVAGELGPELIRRLGVDTVPLFDEIDGNFPNHHPDPGKPENLQDLIKTMQETGADIGLAFDGDGDRLGVVTPKGEILYPDRLMMALSEDLIERVPGARIIFDVKCTGNLATVIEKAGGTPEMWRTGHSLIKARMKETGAALAGEMSGHIFFKERWFGFDDGIYGAARLLEILAKQDVDADTFFARFPQDLGTPEINVEVTDENKFAIVERLASEGDFGSDGVKTTLDGIRVDYADGWGLCRASNTTPMLVLRFEGKSEAALERIKDSFRAALKQAEPSIQAPF